MKAGYASAFLSMGGLECFKRYLAQDYIFLSIVTCGRFTGWLFGWDVCSLLFLLSCRITVLSFTTPLPVVSKRCLSILNSFSSPEVSPFQNCLFYLQC